MENKMTKEMKVVLTQWNKFGDHPLVTNETCSEFEYEESKNEGCGFINTWTIVRPGQYIVEINNLFIGVISEDKAKKLLLI
jgi:hypothetical protein